MAWTDSRIFQAFLTEALKNTLAFDMDGDTFKVALYDNDITPDANVASNLTRYNTGQWTSAGNEVSEAGQWATTGVALTTPTLTNPANFKVRFDAADTASGANADLANVYGCLVYDDTLTNKEGVCFNYFGGANSVTNGTFTVVWNASGIFEFTL